MTGQITAGAHMRDELLPQPQAWARAADLLPVLHAAGYEVVTAA